MMVWGTGVRTALASQRVWSSPIYDIESARERGSSKSFQEIGLISQQPHGVGTGRVQFPGISAAA